MKQLALASLLALGFGGCTDAWNPANPSATGQPAASAPDRDNTGVNARDRDATAKTPIDQNENQSDLDITAKIRQQVVATDLSINGQNVKIMTQDGKVTLRGPVKSDDEKKTIEQIAYAVAGANRVDSQLEVETSP